MSREGHIYELYCDDVDEFYIGSTWDMTDRKYKHKYDCNNAKRHEYNYKVYQYIRANKGYEWKFEILETALFENKTALRIREQHYKNLLNPSLNMCNAYQSEEEKRLSKKEYQQIKFDCPCGVRTGKAREARHSKTKKHQKYLQNITIHNLQNLTININIQ